MKGGKVVKKLLPKHRRTGKVFANAAEEARAIMESTDSLMLDAAWEEYATIRKQEDDYEEGDIISCPAWDALAKVAGHGGNFRKFTDRERPLLEALRKGFLIYDDVLRVLIDHHSDADAAFDLYNKYPDLHSHLPPEYDTPEHMIEVLIEAVKEYEWQLEHFSMTYGEAIDAALHPEAAKALHHLPVAPPDAHEGSYEGSYLNRKELKFARGKHTKRKVKKELKVEWRQDKKVEKKDKKVVKKEAKKEKRRSKRGGIPQADTAEEAPEQM